MILKRKFEKYSYLNKVEDFEIKKYNAANNNNLPSDLVKFYKNYGCGPFHINKNDDYNKLIFSPKEIIDFANNNSDWGKYYEYKAYMEDQIIFFNFEEDFLGIGVKKYNYNQIYYTDIKVANSLDEFIKSFYKNGQYFEEIWAFNYDFVKNVNMEVIHDFYKKPTCLLNDLNKVYKNQYEYYSKLNIPNKIIDFHKKYGYGVIVSKNKKINLFLSPLNIYKFTTKKSQYKLIENSICNNDTLVFFKDSQSRYISIGIKDYNLDQIFYKDQKIANSFDEFINNIIKE